MKKFKFYEVDINYINFLKQAESKIPNIEYDGNNKFLCGVLFEINNIKYYAPISSFNKQQRTNFIIKNRRGDAISSVRLSFMFPIPENLLSVKNFSQENPKYRRLLIDELNYCNRNYNKIVEKAIYIYEQVTLGNNPNLTKVCCDFKLLEQKLSEYILQQEKINMTEKPNKENIDKVPDNEKHRTETSDKLPTLSKLLSQAQQQANEINQIRHKELNKKHNDINLD